MIRALAQVTTVAAAIASLPGVASAQALQAPPAYSTSPPPASNADDERHDSGLGLEWVWFDADVGFGYAGLESFNSTNLSLQNTSSTGPTFSAALGARILFFTFGVRARDLLLSNLSLWQLDADVAFHTRIDHFDPYVGVRGGYTFDGSLGTGAVQAVGGSTPTGVDLHGWNVGAMFGGDYYFNHYLSLGVDINPEILFLQRDKVALPAAYASLPPAQQQQIMSSPLYKEAGTSVGFAFTSTVHLGLHL
jgi:hypothetical protein